MTGQERDGYVTTSKCTRFSIYYICHRHREFILVSNDFIEVKVLLLSGPGLQTARPCDALVTMR